MILFSVLVPSSCHMSWMKHPEENGETWESLSIATMKTFQPKHTSTILFYFEAHHPWSKKNAGINAPLPSSKTGYGRDNLHLFDFKKGSGSSRNLFVNLVIQSCQCQGETLRVDILKGRVKRQAKLWKKKSRKLFSRNFCFWCLYAGFCCLALGLGPCSKLAVLVPPVRGCRHLWNCWVVVAVFVYFSRISLTTNKNILRPTWRAHLESPRKARPASMEPCLDAIIFGKWSGRNLKRRGFSAMQGCKNRPTAWTDELALLSSKSYVVCFLICHAKSSMQSVKPCTIQKLSDHCLQQPSIPQQDLADGTLLSRQNRLGIRWAMNSSLNEYWHQTDNLNHCG